jgi:hypothetical protein
MEEGRRTVGQKRLSPNQRVSGAVGEFVQGPSKRRRRQRWFGHIITAVGEKKYLVRFDNGEERELPSAVLKVEQATASIPPDIPIPTAANIREEALLENAIAEVEQDSAEAEDMPDARPEEEEQELEEEAANAVDDDVQEASSGAQENDNDGRMPGQLPTAAEQSSIRDYQTIKRAAKEKVAALVGHEVTVGTRKNGSMKWKVIATHDPTNENVLKEFDPVKTYGLKDFNCSSYKKSEVLVQMFLQVSFLDWKENVNKLNAAVEAEKCKCKKFSEEEFLVGLALIIGAAEFSQKGVDLFGSKNVELDDEDVWHSISTSPHFEQYMAFSRFKDFRRFLPAIYSDESKKDTDPWYQFSGAIDEFNLIRNTKFVCSKWICADESMCSWRPRTTALGGLPNISFVVRKPEPLGKLILMKLFNLATIIFRSNYKL